MPSAPPELPRLRDRQGPSGLHRRYRRVGGRPHLRDRGGPDNLRWFWSLAVNGPMTRSDRVPKPGGRPKVVMEIRQLARERGPEAITALVKVMTNGKSEAARVAAAAISRAIVPNNKEKLNRTFAEVCASRNTIETVSLSRRNNCHANVCAPVELAPSRQATNGQRRYSCRALRSRYTPEPGRERKYD